ncbi:MAG: hypothetical protein IPJ13_32185 [Saprospiraceae bacterium]|nr:hypothetical protein [Saprospiraceae bacterium]
MADLATEPRWPRCNGTFGEDADLSGRMLYPYITGFQGDFAYKNGVACMTKHFSGGGPQKKDLILTLSFIKGRCIPAIILNIILNHLMLYLKQTQLLSCRIMVFPWIKLPRTWVCLTTNIL